MKARIALFTAVLLTLSSSSFATTYYITKSGDDSYSGTSWNSAWASINKLNDNMSIGDTALFGTGIWYNSQITPPTGNSGGSWTVYACSTFVHNNNDAEKLAGKHLPKIYGGELLTSWTDTTINGNAMYYASWTGSGCYDDGVGEDGLRVYTLSQDDSLVRPRVTLNDVNDPGEFFHDVVSSGLIFAWFYGSVNPNTITTIASCKFIVDMRQDHDHVRFWGLDLRYGKQAIVWMDALCDTCYFEHCHLSRVAHRNHQNPAVVFSGQSDDKSGEFNHIVACSLGWSLNEGYEYGHGGIIEMYSHEHFYVESCYVYGHCNIGVCWKNYPNSSYGPYTGNVVRYSTIKANRVCIYVETDPDRDSIYGNVIIGFEEGYTGVHIASTGPIGGHDYVGSTFVCNNTFYNIRDRFVRMACETGGDCGKYRNSEIKYNVFYEYVDSAHYESPPYFMGFDYAPADCDTAFLIDSNMYYDLETSFDCNCKTEGSIYDWNYWQDTCGADSNGTCDVDPGLNDPANGDFSRPSASNEMNRTYGGRTWTIWGAWQPPSCPPPDVPELYAPADGDTIVNQYVNLDWQDVSGTDKYQVQVDGSASFTSPEVVAEPILPPYTAGGYGDNHLTDSTGTIHYWRVRSFSNSCGWSGWSPSRAFILVDTLAPEAIGP